LTQKKAKEVRRAHLRSVVSVSALSLIIVIVVVREEVVFLVHPLVVFF